MRSRLKLPGKTITVSMHQGGEIVLGCDGAKLFENLRINNHSITAPSAQILFGDDNSQSFETLPQKITVLLHQVPRFCLGMIHWNVNTVTEIIVQVWNYLHL